MVWYNSLSYEDELDLHHTREPVYKHESAALGAAPPRQCERITTIINKNVISLQKFYNNIILLLSLDPPSLYDIILIGCRLL